MNALDIIVIGVVALSALFAFARGFVKEALSILAWVGAALATIYGLPYARPFANQLITSPMIASAAAGIAVFVVSLIVLSLITSAIARRVKQSSLSALDRTLGFLFGAVRGIVLACLGILVLTWTIQEPDWPGWMRDSKTRPYLMTGADYIRSLVPAETRARGAAAASEGQRNYEQLQEYQKLMHQLATPRTTPAASATAPVPAPTYKAGERKEMQRLIESAQ